MMNKSKPCIYSPHAKIFNRTIILTSGFIIINHCSQSHPSNHLITPHETRNKLQFLWKSIGIKGKEGTSNLDLLSEEKLF